MSALLSVRGLRTSFAVEGRELVAVDGVSFDLGPGRTLAIVGESGCGKSVTALSIMGLVASPPGRVQGEIVFEGADLARVSAAEMRELRGNRLSMIFQEPMTSLNPAFTVGEQIAEVLLRHRAASREEARTRAIDLLRQVHVPSPESRFADYPHRLSGGMRQRVMIAMALACRPKLLIADEPTTALDVTIQAQVLALLDELQREMGMAVLFITHDLNLVRRFGHRVGVMEKGRLVEVGPTAEVFAHPRHAYTRKLLASRPQRVVHSVAGDAPILLEGEHIDVEFHSSAGWFRKRTLVAVRDATLRLRRGETLGIVGESGSGKT